MHLLSVCFISYIKRYGKSLLVSVSDLFMQKGRKPKAIARSVPVRERLLYLHAARTASTDTDNRFKEACVCVRKTRSTANTTFPGMQSPECFPRHACRCQLRAFVLSGSCLETNRMLSEHTNARIHTQASVRTRAVENMTLLKMQNQPPREHVAPWDWPFLLFQQYCMYDSVYILVWFFLSCIFPQQLEKTDSDKKKKKQPVGLL